MFYLKTKTPMDAWVHNTAPTVVWRLPLLLFQTFDHPLPFFSVGKTFSFHWCSPSVIEMETTDFKIRLERICFIIKNEKSNFFLFLIYPLFLLCFFKLFFPLLVLIFSHLSPLLQDCYIVSSSGPLVITSVHFKPIHTVQYTWLRQVMSTICVFFDANK